ncbi:hypothetical protein LTR78_010898 [Recurvomyces mirabilis]|uniref:PCI domain-containing protein n=1 Tax=Recurvomyces mirabilis TaxID=574656 RepID=A0AAE0TLV8_9PEZI|nr:hypothetical protein LTR78_010898 [Recurvomyces mirabilis]KAK5151703.1 hypothetical protein LTS14_009190 [Recurvomyces mirabilis]
MAFGDPSQAVQAAAGSSLSRVSASSDDSQDTLILTQTEYLDRPWLIRHLRRLNEIGKPRLYGQQLSALASHVEQQLKPYLGRLLIDVLEDIAPILAATLIQARFPHSLSYITGMAQTPLLGQYLVQINGFISARNETSLADWIALEPPFNQHYQDMVKELQAAYPRGSDDALEQRCTAALKAAVEGDDGSPWTSFVKFMVQYLAYLRNVSAEASRYLETYELLSELQQRANSALSHATLGHLILPTVVMNAKLVCRLAIGLDKQPELIAHLRRSGPGAGGGDEGGGRETLPERAANILRQAFVTCLNDRVSGLNAQGKPEGKKKGIYNIANLCLKILFQCRKTRNATQIFENIYNLSPPLSAYPKRQRVTYLYYLGRFLFQNSHFYRAQLALQHAYDESPARPECARQRRHILVYLIASNIILGRFPSQELLSRPEAHGLSDRFLPICMAIQRGNLAAFRQHLDLDGPHAEWFLHFRILLQLQNRCEVLVWRSLVRRTFLLVGFRPTDTTGNKASTLNIDHLVSAFQWLEDASRAQKGGEDYTDPDFEDVEYDDGGFRIDITAVESRLASLIDQGLLSGFISHRLQKFAITGTKSKGGDAVAAGFPQVWDVLRLKTERAGTDDVPGWKKEVVGGFGGGQRPGPGMVFNLSGLRPVGAVG